MWIKPAYFPYFGTFNVTVMGSNPTFTFLIQTTNCNWNARKSNMSNVYGLRPQVCKVPYLFEFILSSLASNPKIVGLNPMLEFYPKIFKIRKMGEQKKLLSWSMNTGRRGMICGFCPLVFSCMIIILCLQENISKSCN